MPRQHLELVARTPKQLSVVQRQAGGRGMGAAANLCSETPKVFFFSVFDSTRRCPTSETPSFPGPYAIREINKVHQRSLTKERPFFVTQRTQV